MTLYLNGKRIPERLDDDVEHIYGSSNDVRLNWETADADAHYLGLAMTGASRNFIISEDRNIDWGHAASTNPTLFIHSSDSTDVTDWISLAHNQTNALLSTGNGALNVVPASSVTRLLDSTAVGGLVVTSTTTNATLSTISTAAAVLQLQFQTFTAGASHGSVLISPSWTAENFAHTGASISATQNGANSSSLIGLSVSVTKDAAASTLATAYSISTGLTAGAGSTITTGTGVFVNSPVGGTITTMYGINISDQSLAGGTTAAAINIASQTANATTTRAINIAGTGVNNAIRLGGSPNIYSSAANIVRLTDATNVDGFVFQASTSATQEIYTVATDAQATLTLQQLTVTPGAAHNAVAIRPTWTTENFAHAGLLISATQNGANTQSLRGLEVNLTKATGATTLANAWGILVATTALTGTVTTTIGMDIDDQSLAGSTSSFGIRVRSQTANATTTRAIELSGTGVNNAIRLGASPNVYSSASETIRFSDSTDVNGLSFVLTATANQTINTITATTGSLILQSQTFTPGATHYAVQINPVWTAENFSHTSLRVTATQNGANSDNLAALRLGVVKATGATTLANSSYIVFDAPVTTGAVTNIYGLYFNNLGNANHTNSYPIFIVAQSGSATTMRAIEIGGTGVANAIRLGSSPNIYSSAAQTIRFSDSTDVNGLSFVLTATATQTINTITATTGIVALQSQTFTAGANHTAVRVNPTWAQENFSHEALWISATQNGTNSVNLVGLDTTLTKATGATTLAAGYYHLFSVPSVTGTITNLYGSYYNNLGNANNTNSYPIYIVSQSGSATTMRAINLVGTGVANAIRLGDSANIYSNGAENIRFMDSTDGGGLSFTMTASGDQQINTTDTAANSIEFQQQTFTAGATHLAVAVLPTWAAENQSHTGLGVVATQNGANSSGLFGIAVGLTKATGATTLATATTLLVDTLLVTGTVTNAYGVDIADHSTAGGTTSYGIRIQSQTANATTTRAIEIVGTGVNNGIRLGSSPNIYSSGAETIRLSDSTDVNGLSYVLTATANQTINTITATTGTIILQNQTFTAGATHSAVQITPTWAAENQNHRGLNISVTQNGANSDASGFGLEGLRITTTKDATANNLITMIGLDIAQVIGATATVTTLAGINLVAPTGAATNAFGIDIPNYSLAGGTYAAGLRIQSQTANATTTLALDIAGTGVNNAIRLGSSPHMYSNAANNIRFADATNVNGINFNLLATANQTINTVSATTGSLLIQNQTFTAGATHSAVAITPTWATENQTHNGLALTVTQNGANSVSVNGMNISMVKATGATTLAVMEGIFVGAFSVTGIVTTAYGIEIGNVSTASGTTSYAIQIGSQTANATTTRAINIAGTGVNNAISLGGSPNIYSSAAETIRFMDSTDAGGMSYALTSATTQTITSIGANTGFVFSQAVGTTGATGFTFNPGAHTAITAATERVGMIFNSVTKTWAAGAGPLAAQREFEFLAPTYIGNAGGALTITNAATVYISASPIQGANMIIMTSYALWVDSGISRFDGAIIGNQGTDIASATNIMVPVDGNVFELTGTTKVDLISNLNFQDGHQITLVANENVVIDHGTATSGTNITILLNGGVDYSMTANDTLTLVLSSTTASGQAWRECSRSVN